MSIIGQLYLIAVGTVRVWHNCRFHLIRWTPETATILHQLKRDQQSDAFMNPTDREWLVLSQYREGGPQ